MPQPSLKRKFDDEYAFISFKSPLKKNDKKVLGLKTPEPLTKSLLKKKSAKQLEEYEKSKELPFEINEEDFEDNSASHNNYNYNLLSDTFNLHSMEDDDDEASDEGYDIMNHILKEAGATPTKRIKFMHTPNKWNQPNNNNIENEHNKSTKKVATFAQPKPQQHQPQQQHQQQHQVIITKRPLTVPQSPKLFTKRLR